MRWSERAPSDGATPPSERRPFVLRRSVSVPQPAMLQLHSDNDARGRLASILHDGGSTLVAINGLSARLGCGRR